MRRLAFALFLSLAALAAWLGCNSLLDITDPIFVPLDGTFAGDAGPGVVQTGPVIASRGIVRVPKGERTSFIVTVDPSGKSGAVVLTAKALVSPDVSVFQTPEGNNRFRVTLSSKPDAKLVDEKLLMQAITDSGQLIGQTEVRVVVGDAGTFDKSYGKEGTVTTIGAPQQVQAAMVGTTLLFVAEDNTVWELADDGLTARPVFGLDLKGKTECGIAAIAADPGTVLGTGFCPQGAENFLVQAPRALDGGTAPIEIVPQQDLFKITRFADAGWYLAIAPDGGIDVHAWPAAPAGLLQGAFVHVPITQGTSIVPGDGGLMVVGREVDPANISEVARLAGTPLSRPQSYGDAGIVTVDIAELPTEDLPVATASTYGSILLATPAPDKVVLQGFNTKGGQTNGSSLDGFTRVSVASDRRDRFVVAASGVDGKCAVRRFKADGTVDDTWGTNVNVVTCPYPQVSVDEDGMIVVFCPGTPNALSYRVWP
jgi:hypothetical protein